MSAGRRRRNDHERALWADNVESIYLDRLASGLSVREYVRRNREALDRHIDGELDREPTGPFARRHGDPEAHNDVATECSRCSHRLMDHRRPFAPHTFEKGVVCTIGGECTACEECEEYAHLEEPVEVSR